MKVLIFSGGSVDTQTLTGSQSLDYQVSGFISDFGYLQTQNFSDLVFDGYTFDSFDGLLVLEHFEIASWLFSIFPNKIWCNNPFSTLNFQNPAYRNYELKRGGFNIPDYTLRYPSKVYPFRDIDFESKGSELVGDRFLVFVIGTRFISYPINHKSSFLFPWRFTNHLRRFMFSRNLQMATWKVVHVGRNELVRPGYYIEEMYPYLHNFSQIDDKNLVPEAVSSLFLTRFSHK